MVLIFEVGTFNLLPVRFVLLHENKNPYKFQPPRLELRGASKWLVVENSKTGNMGIILHPHQYYIETDLKMYFLLQLHSNSV